MVTTKKNKRFLFPTEEEKDKIRINKEKLQSYKSNKQNMFKG